MDAEEEEDDGDDLGKFDLAGELSDLLYNQKAQSDVLILLYDFKTTFGIFIGDYHEKTE